MLESGNSRTKRVTQLNWPIANKCEKTSHFTTVSNGDTTYITQLKQQKGVLLFIMV